MRHKSIVSLDVYPDVDAIAPSSVRKFIEYIANKYTCAHISVCSEFLILLVLKERKLFTLDTRWMPRLFVPLPNHIDREDPGKTRRPTLDR